MSKPYSYLSEKSYILKKRNLLNNLDLEDKSILNNYNYYNLINAYKEPFLKTRTSNNQEEYKNHVKLSHLESLSTFDIKMRGLFLTNILQIEENIKNILIDSFYLINNSLSDCLEVESEYLHKKYFNLDNIYSTNNFDRNTSRFYCEFNNIPSPRFNYTIDRKTIYYDFVANAYREINKQKRDRNKKNKNNSIKSYIEKHDIVPLWILVNNLTLGNISYFYIIQKNEVQELYLKKTGFYNLRNINLTDLIFNTSNILKILTLCRNICAHNERLYNYTVSIPLSDNFLFFSNCLPFHEKIKNGSINRTESDVRKKTRSGLYAFIFSIYIFLEPANKTIFIKKINKYFLELKSELDPKDYRIILSIMGMNFDWFNSIQYSKLF